MTIQLDHLIVPSKNRVASAEFLAKLLGVPWAAAGSAGPFSPVYVSDSLTLDFDQHEDGFPILHFCFRVTDAEFDAIFARIRATGLEYRSKPHGAADFKINTAYGGRIVYWDKPDGHVWELLTESYARRPAATVTPA